MKFEKGSGTYSLRRNISLHEHEPLDLPSGLAMSYFENVFDLKYIVQIEISDDVSNTYYGGK